MESKSASKAKTTKPATKPKTIKPKSSPATTAAAKAEALMAKAAKALKAAETAKKKAEKAARDAKSKAEKEEKADKLASEKKEKAAKKKTEKSAQAKVSNSKLKMPVTSHEHYEKISQETPLQRKLFAEANKAFNENEWTKDISATLLRGIFAHESFYGMKLKLEKKYHKKEAVGWFQINLITAKECGLIVDATKGIDERFDFEKSCRAAYNYLIKINKGFYGKENSVSDSEERIKFMLAGYNLGFSTVRKSQKEALAAGKNPALWSDVEKYLPMEKEKIIDKKTKKVIETRLKESQAIKYVSDVLKHEKAFDSSGHWVTIKGNAVFIENKK